MRAPKKRAAPDFIHRVISPGMERGEFSRVADFYAVGEKSKEEEEEEEDSVCVCVIYGRKKSGGDDDGGGF